MCRGPVGLGAKRTLTFMTIYVFHTPFVPPRGGNGGVDYVVFYLFSEPMLELNDSINEVLCPLGIRVRMALRSAVVVA